MAKAAGSSKHGGYQGKRIRPIQVTQDTDFYDDQRNRKEMYAAQLAKFSQNEDLKHLLLATKDAKLQHLVKGSKPVLMDSLILIRDKLRKQRIPV